MEPTSTPPFRLGPWRVQPTLNRVSRGDDTVRLTPKAMHVLLCLAEQHGHVVRRDDLLEAVWPDVVVNQDVLTRAISDLRKAFDDSPQTPRFIETIPKAGYRLIAPVDFAYAGDAIPDVVPTLNPAFSPPPAASPSAPTRRGPILGVAVAAVALATLGGLWFAGRGPATETPTPAAPLTTLPGREHGPALSPDGRQVAFAWAGADGENDDIYVQLVGDAAPLRLTDDPATDAGPVWSPDGSRIAFMRYADDTCTLYTISALGDGERRLAPCGDNVTADPAWSPDGRTLAFADRPAPEASYSIFLLDLETLERRQLTAPTGQHWGDSAPSFSPDGLTVAFTRAVSHNTQDIYLIPTAGGEARRLTTDGGMVRGHAWTPDGAHLVVASNRDGPLTLWRVPVDGGQPTWISPAGLNAAWPTAAAGRIVFEQRTDDVNLWRLTRDGAAAPWISATRLDLHPAYAPDGERVAFVSDRSGFVELWTADRDGAGAVALTAFGASFVGSPRWSPDGRRIAFDARPDGQADVFVVDADGGLPRRLTTADANDLAPAWSPDGRWIYFGSNRTGAWQIWRMPADGGTAEQVTTDGGYTAMPDADGTLYVSRYDGPGLLRLPADGGVPDPLLADRGSFTPNRWILHPDGLFFIDRTADGATPGSGPGQAVARLDPSTSAVTPAFNIPEAVPGAGLAVSPDGATVLYGRLDRQSADLMVMDGPR